MSNKGWLCWNLEAYIEDVLMTCIARIRFCFVQEAELRWVEAEKDLEKALEEVEQLHIWFTLQQWPPYGPLCFALEACKPTASYSKYVKVSVQNNRPSQMQVQMVNTSLVDAKAHAFDLGWDNV